MEKVIKITAGNVDFSNLFLRQTPKLSGNWGENKFVVNEKVEKCDWWIVCHNSGLKKPETVMCDPSHIVYVSMEPSESIVNSSMNFLNQFSMLILCDRNIKHRHVIYKNIITWWVGIEVSLTRGSHKFSKKIKYDYDQFQVQLPPNKMDRISIIVSGKKKLPGHRRRLDFIKKLMKSPSGKYIDIYGADNPILDKLDAINPYKYHLVIENTELEDYWSEKLGDAYLGFSYPIYIGCPNISEYFPEKSYEKISFGDINSISKKIIDIISNNTYEKNFEYLSLSRNLILNKYNLFQILSDLCSSKSDILMPCTLYPNTQFISLSGKILSKLKKLFLYFSHLLPYKINS